MTDSTHVGYPWKKPAFLILTVWLLSRFVYFGIGLWARQTPPPFWQGRPGIHRVTELISNHPFVVWDSGFYLRIAYGGYRDRRPDFASRFKNRFRSLLPRHHEASGHWPPYRKAFSELAFFPLYPTLVAQISKMGLPDATAGVLLSNIAHFAGAVVLLGFLKQEFDEKSALFGALFYLLQPFGCILSGVLTESLFNLILFLGLWAMHLRRFGWATAAGAALSITRPFGLLFFPMLLPPLLRSSFSRRRAVGKWIFLCMLGLIPLLLHMGWLYLLTKDPLAFFHAQEPWRRGLKESALRQLGYEMAFSLPHRFEATVLLLSAALVWLAFRYARTLNGKRLPVEYVIYSALFYFLILKSGSVISAPRFTLTLFPLYIGAAYGLAKIRWPWLWLGISFAAGCWVMFVWTRWSAFLI